ncbi:hypothetical protein [Nocardia amikacinitolerans]|nr:hypothetical protein [Nocardia amikacinitolerans]MCP2292593.1 hypothetical protein [Nocardia amikacinitolerans]
MTKRILNVVTNVGHYGRSPRRSGFVLELPMHLREVAQAHSAHCLT